MEWEEEEPPGAGKSRDCSRTGGGWKSCGRLVSDSQQPCAIINRLAGGFDFCAPVKMWIPDTSGLLVQGAPPPPFRGLPTPLKRLEPSPSAASDKQDSCILSERRRVFSARTACVHTCYATLANSRRWAITKVESPDLLWLPNPLHPLF